LQLAAGRPLVSFFRRRYPAIVGIALATAIGVPFAIRQNAWYEWANPYWLLLLQRDEILATGRPSYFIHLSPSGIFYPVNLFYAGFTISVLAYAAVVFPPWLVFCAAITGSAFAAFVGVRWTARALGVGEPIGTTLAALYVMNPQYVAKLYTRGAWAEFVAVSMATLLLGSCLRLVTERHDRVASRAAVWVAISAAAVAGTHNLTLAIGLPFAAVLTGAHAYSLHRERRAALRACLLPGLAISMGIGATGIFTIPNLWLSSSTAITSWDYLGQVPDWNTPSAVLRPHLGGSIDRVNEAPSILLLPVAMLIAFRLIPPRNGVSRSPGARPPGTPVVVTAGLLVAAVLLLTTQDSLWSNRSSVLHRIMPEKALLTIQFPSRLTAFFAIALVVLTASLLASATERRARRVTNVLIVAAAIWYVALAVAFTASVDRSQNAGAASITRQSVQADEVPSSFASGHQSQQTQFLLTERGASIDLPNALARFDSRGYLERGTTVRAGGRYATNIVWSPLVRVDGGRILGRDAAGIAVLEVSDARRLRAVPAHPAGVLLGLLMSLGTLTAIAAWLARAAALRRGKTNGEPDLPGPTRGGLERARSPAT
jgi:hypothetical protein